MPEIVALHEQLVAPGTGPARGSVLPRDTPARPLTAAQRLSVKTIRFFKKVKRECVKTLDPNTSLLALSTMSSAGALSFLQCLVGPVQHSVVGASVSLSVQWVRTAAWVRRSCRHPSLAAEKGQCCVDSAHVGCSRHTHAAVGWGHGCPPASAMQGRPVPRQLGPGTSHGPTEKHGPRVLLASQMWVVPGAPDVRSP